jgi:hypothetical protein
MRRGSRCWRCATTPWPTPWTACRSRSTRARSLRWQECLARAPTSSSSPCSVWCRKNPARCSSRGAGSRQEELRPAPVHVRPAQPHHHHHPDAHVPAGPVHPRRRGGAAVRGHPPPAGHQAGWPRPAHHLPQRRQPAEGAHGPHAPHRLQGPHPAGAHPGHRRGGQGGDPPHPARAGRQGHGDHAHLLRVLYKGKKAAEFNRQTMDSEKLVAAQIGHAVGGERS